VQDQLRLIEENKLIAVIRSSSSEDAEAMIKATMAGGFRIFQISVQTPQAFRLIEDYVKKGDCVVGAGAVTDGEVAQRAIRAGAHFISTPYTDRDVISVSKNNDCLVIQGAMTATEAVNAHQLGSDLVTLYPITILGGVPYVKAMKNVIPFLKIAAAGDITLETVGDYLKECSAVFLKQSLFEKPLVRNDKWGEITEIARQFTQKVEPAKVSR